MYVGLSVITREVLDQRHIYGTRFEAFRWFVLDGNLREYMGGYEGKTREFLDHLMSVCSSEYIKLSLDFKELECTTVTR